MKTNSKSIARAVSSNSASTKTIASSSMSMFLGSKALGERRILMRLASPAALHNRLAAVR